MYIAAIIIVGAILFIPAGTLDYWQAWLFIPSFLIPAIFISIYFYKKDPKFLERRMKYKEKEAKQKSLIFFSSIFFIIGFAIPGLDYRFQWSNMAPEISIWADILFLLGYFICFLAFKENSYASRIVEVTEDQTVITTGPYSIVRHPMYVGVIIMFLAIPFALGSYFAFPVFLLTIPLIILRTLDEEKVLLRDLKGYKEYCKKTKYRLIPFIW